MERRYRALRIIATIFKVIGWVVLVLGILSACVTSLGIAFGGASFMFGEPGQFGQPGWMTLAAIATAVVAFVVTVATVGLYGLLLIAASEAVSVFLDIEANTREMARRLGQREGSAGPSVPS